MTEEEEVDYIRGWFDGEGSISIDCQKNGAARDCPEIELWVKSKFIAEWLQEKLLKRNITTRTRFGKRDWQSLLVIRQKSSITAFAEKVGFVHPEKDAKMRAVPSRCMSQNQNVARQFGGIS